MSNSCQIHIQAGNFLKDRLRKLKSYCTMSNLRRFCYFTFYSNYVNTQPVSLAFWDFPSPPPSDFGFLRSTRL